MLIWVILFLVVVGVSFIMAFRSMKDYREAPPRSVSCSVFLIGNPQALTLGTLQKLGEVVLKERLVISFERLFKGPKRALVVFGPFDILRSFSEELKLTEIEDYSKSATGEMRAWEVGKKHSGLPIESLDLLDYVPVLRDNEEFWWQVVLWPRVDDSFNVTIRAVFKGSTPERLAELQEEMTKIGRSQGLSILPQAYSSGSVIKFYQERSFPLGISGQKGEQLILSAEKVYSLLGI